MKNLFLFCFLAPFFAAAQNPETPVLKNELGLNLYSLTKTQYSYYSGMPGLANSFFNGIYYKHHCNKNTLRASVDYFQSGIAYESGQPYEYYSRNYGIYRGAEVRLGYERDFGNCCVVPYVFADASTDFSETKGYMEGSGDILPYFSYHYRYQRNAVGIAPGLGVKWKITKNLVLGYEANVNFMFGITQDKYSAGSRRTSLDYYVNPVRAFTFGILF